MNAIPLVRRGHAQPQSANFAARRCAVLSWLILLPGIAVPSHALAQHSLVLEGRVVSETGDPIGDVQISAVEVTTGERRHVLTRENGEFRVLGLSPGNYRVRAHVIGYAALVQTVELNVGRPGRVVFVLEPAATGIGPIDVVARRAPSLEMQRTSVSTPVTEREIEHLPLNTRNIMDLAAVAPGIRSVRAVAGRAQLTAGGLRGERFLNLYVDGVGLKNVFDGNLVGYPQLGAPLPVESLQEFRVYLNPFDVEYTGAAAFTISAVTRRGTNRTEGSAFGYFLDGRLVASSDFLRAQPNYSKPDFERQQAGLSLRGPIVKDRLFYAASYELANTRDFIAVVPGRPTFDPGFWDGYAGTFAAPHRNHTGLLRLTYSPRDESVFDLIWSARRRTGEALFGGPLSYEAARADFEIVNTVNLRHRWLATPRLLNELSLQLVDWTHDVRPLVPGPELLYPTLTVGRAQTAYVIDETHLRLLDRATYDIPDFHGTHLVRAGVDIARVRVAHFSPLYHHGSFRFDAETDTLPAVARIGVGRFHPGSDRDAHADLAGWVTSVYLADEWRPTPRLTLNLGLRYDAEINTLNNGFTVPWADDPELSAKPELRRFLNRGNRKNDLDNVAPRLSFSWDVAGRGRTFVRGGFGIIYDRVPSFIALFEERDATWRTYSFNHPGTRDPDVLRQRVASGAVEARPSFHLVKDRMEAPENRQWSVGLGHQITRALGLNVDYIHHDTRHIFAVLNVNWRDRSQNSVRHALSADYGDIFVWDDFARARYGALLSQLTFQPDADWRFALAYTLGSARADWDVRNAEVPAASAGEYFVLQRISGDERHRFVLSGVGELPFGLTLSLLATVASPRPYPAIDGRDVNLNGFDGDDWIDGKRYRLPANVWQNWYRIVDVRAAHTIPFPGRARVSVVAEAFNLFNAENYSGFYGRQKTVTGQNAIDFGKPNGVFGTREIQLGLRVQF